MRFRRRPGAGRRGRKGPSRAATTTALAALAAATLLAACSSGSSSSTLGFRRDGVQFGQAPPGRPPSAWTSPTTTRPSGPPTSTTRPSTPSSCTSSCSARCSRGNNASLQNTQIENLVNEGAKAIIVNPETATSLGPAISYAAAHHVQLVSVDTIVGVGQGVHGGARLQPEYGLDACAVISSKVKSGYVLDLEGDLTSSNGADRTNAFNDCMAKNAPAVHILKDPTNWTEATAVTDAQNAVNAYGSQLKAIYSQWSSPDTGIIPLLKSKGLTGKVHGGQRRRGAVRDVRHLQRHADASQSQPANLYAYWALKYALDAANGVKLGAGQPGGGAPALQMVSFAGDSNLGDPIVAPFVTKAAQTLTVTPVDGLSGTVATTPVSDSLALGQRLRQRPRRRLQPSSAWR